jgi:hypothetical protein
MVQCENHNSIVAPSAISSVVARSPMIDVSSGCMTYSRPASLENRPASDAIAKSPVYATIVQPSANGGGLELAERLEGPVSGYVSMDKRRQRRCQQRRIDWLGEICLKSGFECVSLAVSVDVCTQGSCR